MRSEPSHSFPDAQVRNGKAGHHPGAVRLEGGRGKLDVDVAESEKGELALVLKFIVHGCIHFECDKGRYNTPSAWPLHGEYMSGLLRRSSGWVTENALCFRATRRPYGPSGSGCQRQRVQNSGDNSVQFFELNSIAW